MKKSLIILFLIILTTSMILVEVGCKKTEEAAVAETSLVETTATVATQATTSQKTISEVGAPSASPGTSAEDKTA